MKFTASVPQVSYNSADIDPTILPDIVSDGDLSGIAFMKIDGQYGRFWYRLNQDRNNDFNRMMTLIKGEKSMFKTLTSDMKVFIAEHKQTLYWVAILFLADHFFFQGAFRERLHGIMNKMLGKVEAHVEGTKPVALAPPVSKT